MEEHQVLSLGGKPVQVTGNAIARFQERWVQYQRVPLREDRALKVLKRLFKQARKTDLAPAERVKRLIDNNFKGAEYWECIPWRFVVEREKGELILKTIERIR